MCGIAGIFSKNKIERSVIKSMTDIIAHRGPDGEGHWMNEDETLALGHRRLSIIDLSDAGKQPMHYQDRYTIIFNGEIYNYIELKENLLKDGFIFKSDSDTEVLLALFSKHGKSCLKLLDGMYAFAIFDRVKKELFCARDRFGEKPFFYAYQQGEYFMFGSEIKQLFAAGVSREFNAKQLYNYFENIYALTNPNDEHDTFYANIKKLPKACCVFITESLHLKEERYWDIDLNDKKTISYNEAVEEFRELFFESVKRRMRSDVPVGSSLSGGIDSSSIVCSIQRLFRENGIVQKTFSARFENYHRDEGKYIQYVLDLTNVTSYSVWPSELGFVDDLNKLMYHQDEPFPGASIYAQYCVMAEAKRQNVVVLLDGQGADEILAGYEYYLPFYLKELSLTNKDLFAKEMEQMKKIHPHMKFDERFNYALQKEELPVKSVKEKIKNIIRPAYKLINVGKYSRIEKKLPLNTGYTEQFFNKIRNEQRFDFSCDKNSLNDYLKFSVKTNNLEDLLRFSDRNSMAHSREVRLPFLSTQLVEFLFSLPASYKVRKGWTKALLRDAMKDILPPEIEKRVDKIGYEPPQKKWMENPKMQEQIKDSYQTLINKNILSPKSLAERKTDWQVLNVAALIN